jgi:septal ring factor EnvC (AmiA/AmiB activator)
MTSGGKKRVSGMLNKIKLIVVAVIVVAFVGALLFGYVERKEAEEAKAKVEAISKENAELSTALKTEIAERQKVERVLGNWVAENDRIQKESAAKLAKKDNELKELRAKHESVDEYLNIPVPIEYLDWLRGRVNGENR